MTKDPVNKENQDLEKSIAFGVSEDNIDLKTVSFWIVLGIVLVIIILFGVYNMYNYNQFLSSQQAAIDAEYHELDRMRERDHRMLNTFELVDEENRRYRIPIDSAMALIARD
ncbi:MAG: hypothetical protein EA363_01215 [Balneolaceae bacterium]|nr:MAG: hypothetical protein EA363_01215 [Balneolaceae bacterium]